MISRFAKSLFIIIFTIFILAMLAMLHPPSRAYIDPWTGQLFGEGGVENTWRPLKVPGKDHPPIPIAGVEGGVIMSKLGNETANIGTSYMEALHPTNDEREALDSYLHLTSRLYPCGECATEFQELLKRFPPQTSSRRAASLWLCAVHNKVNERLKKSEFDCANLSSEYDCGCGDGPLDSASPATGTDNTPQLDPVDLEHDPSKDDITGAGLIKGGR